MSRPSGSLLPGQGRIAYPDTKTGLQLGEVVRLRGFDYTVVGLTRNMVGLTPTPSLMLGSKTRGITHTFTLDKIKDIAVLKLLATQTSRIYSMIIQQAVLMGLLRTVLGAMLEFASDRTFQEGFRQRLETWGKCWSSSPSFQFSPA